MWHGCGSSGVSHGAPVSRVPDATCIPGVPGRCSPAASPDGGSVKHCRGSGDSNAPSTWFRPRLRGCGQGQGQQRPPGRKEVAGVPGAASRDGRQPAIPPSLPHSRTHVALGRLQPSHLHIAPVTKAALSPRHRPVDAITQRSPPGNLRFAGVTHHFPPIAQCGPPALSRHASQRARPNR